VGDDVILYNVISLGRERLIKRGVGFFAIGGGGGRRALGGGRLRQLHFTYYFTKAQFILQFQKVSRNIF
jgi:hypothetical protein